MRWVLLMCLLLCSCATHKTQEQEECPPGSKDLWCWGVEHNATQPEDKPWYSCVNWGLMFKKETIYVVTTGKMPPPSIELNQQDTRLWLCK